MVRLHLYKQKFNRLTVLDFAYIKNEKSYWNCLCDCGNEIVTAGWSLKSGRTKSCGCLQKETVGEFNKNRFYGNKYNITKQFMFDEYITKIKSLEQIAKDMGCSSSTIHKYLKKYDIQTRSNSEANTGRKFSDEHRKNISEAKKGKYCGKDSPNYNPNLTDEDRIDRRHIPGYREWVKAVYRLDFWTCRKCGSKKNIQAHHIEDYGSNPKVRTEVSNGITLCEICHREFHHQYGQGNNTRAQLNNFMNGL